MLTTKFIKKAPPQTQPTQPGKEEKMNPVPIFDDPAILKGDKLKDKVVIITGGDSGIGRAVAVAFAKEGAHVAIVYHPSEQADADALKAYIENLNARCLLISADLREPTVAKEITKKTIDAFGKINILVNNAAVQYPKDQIDEITDTDFLHTFQINFFATFYLTRAVASHLNAGDCIINTTSVTAYEGSPQLLDYSSTKGAMTAFTRSLALNLAPKGIRVNSVAPGPIWTPLIPASFDEVKVSEYWNKSFSWPNGATC